MIDQPVGSTEGSSQRLQPVGSTEGSSQRIQPHENSSLAERAAAWIPPWQREMPAATPAISDEAPEDSTPPDADEAAFTEVAVIMDDDHTDFPEECVVPADEAEAADAPGDTTADDGPVGDDVDLPGDDADPLGDDLDVLGDDVELPGTDVDLARGTLDLGGDDPDLSGGDVDLAGDGDVVEVASADVAQGLTTTDEAVAAGPMETSGTAVPEMPEVVAVLDAALAVEPPGALLAQAELSAAIEAILLVVDEPVGEITLAQVLEQPTERVFDALVGLAESYTQQGRGFELRRAAGGWRLYTREAYAAYVERFVLDGQSVRLTQAALETLAVVAYKQPVTRSRISAIRGVNCDGVVRTLVSRGLIEECGAEPDSGAHLYRTTGLFLEKLGLDALDQLPPLAPFLPDNVEELSDAAF